MTVIDIGQGEQFTSGFVKINPNSKIPACIDKQGPSGVIFLHVLKMGFFFYDPCFTLFVGGPINLFESASIMQYFAVKHDKFIPPDMALRQECYNWLYWQMGGLGPICGQFGHFFTYAPANKVEARNYGVARYGEHFYYR
jgi:GST-like protein